MDKETRNMSPTAALAEQRRLLEMEYEAEKRSFSQLSDRIGVFRLVERGNAWYPVNVGRSYYNSLNRRVVEISRDACESEVDHAFDHGRSVVFFTVETGGASRPRRLFAGTVAYVDENRMVVVIPDDAPLSSLTDAASAGVMLSFDETTYRAMFNALDRVAVAKGRLGELRDLVYSRREAGRLSIFPMRFPYLNGAQQQAVNNVLMAKDVAVVHGPPGTGKTTTLVEAIYETLRRETQVLVCAQSNMAVDWISEKLVDRGLNVLRIGNPSRVDDKMLSFTYERRFEAHPDYSTLWSIRKAIRELYAAGRRHSSESRHQKIERLKERAVELEMRINADLFGSARVIACTLVGSSSSVLEGMKFSTLFIDEAAQALEAACWIGIRRAGRVVLAGDHCQLPPTVKCYEAMRQGLGKSLMERIVDNHPEAVSLLAVQYRMNRAIMQFSANRFYGGQLKADPSVADRTILSFDPPVEWIDTSDYQTDSDNPDGDSLSFEEAIAGNSYGRINPEEARLTVEALEAYLTQIGIPRVLDENIDIGVISPYRAQAIYLRRLINRSKFFKPVRRMISVNTVDGFQGRERDVIVMSLVRSNERGEIGFLRDLRRMNVAMTRARMKLLIIGNAATLTRHPFYRSLHHYISSLN